ncbi:MAG TPA: DUF4231 domain-containing protein [Solirubrobacteraceae bacterium]|nr:DUF4231 domain-containing protein [Solirubrobacteraceae bacterium]
MPDQHTTAGDDFDVAYCRERVEDQIAWYERKSMSCKRIYLWMQAVAVVVAACVPVTTSLAQEVPQLLIAATVLGLTVALVAAFESVMHYREQWKNYRSTANYLKREREFFRHRAGPYRGMGDGDARISFVERVEEAIENEGLATLSVLAVPPQTQPAMNGAAADRP